MVESAQQQGYGEVILLNERGEVAECTSANIFAVSKGVTYTPPLRSGPLPGVTRAVMLEELDEPVEEKTLSVEDLHAADEVFITSSTRELLPVDRILDQELPATGPGCGPATPPSTASWPTSSPPVERGRIGVMEDATILRERAVNIWASFTRKFEPMSQSTTLEPIPSFDLSRIGGLASAKDEIQTYACAATDPDVYARWGTHPPSGVLLIGQRSVGKTLLARCLASLTETSFLEVAIPRLVLEVIHRGGKVGELMSGWSDALEEMPPLTVLFNELEFLQAEEIGARRPDLPVGPVMDFLLDLVDRAIVADDVLVMGATAHPDTLRHAFTAPGRLERIVEVTPQFPDDIVSTLALHAAEAEKRAGRPLFQDMSWEQVVAGIHTPAPGDWVHILHAVLRRKARCEAAGETVTPVTTEDFRAEVDRFRRASSRLVTPSGNYV